MGNDNLNMGVEDGHTYYNARGGNDEMRFDWREQYESARESYKVVTIDRGYHMSTWRFGKLLLDKYCLASEREETSMMSIIPTLSLLSKIMTCPLIMTPPHSVKILWLKFSRNSRKFSPVKDFPQFSG